MTRVGWWLLLALSAALAGLAAVLSSEPAGSRVRRRAAAAGVDPRIAAFLDWWELSGPFPVTVGDDGGVRTDEAKQALYFARGTSKAATLAQTPHGRAAAVDLYPHVDGRVRGLDGDPDMAEALRYFERLGTLAELHGLTWGGRWATPDRPHLEVPDWRTLPYPASGRGVA